MTAPVFAAPTRDAAEFFAARGWVVTATLDAAGAARLRDWVDEVMRWPDDGEWLHYREQTDAGPRLCRTENFVPFHAGLRELLTAGPMRDVAGALLGEPAVLYKEKINYKAAGGAGYAPHQDAPAYRFVEQHVSCMVAVDDADEENGCLEVVSGAHAELLPVDADGCIRADVVAALAWEPVPVPAGSTLWFHSRTPHRSGPNRSDRDRRALYPTYNAAREGDLRAAYYRQKHAELAAVAGGPTVPVSLINDFQGRPVDDR
ncbi:MAG: phytanoyl-CoA dioxygenase family protein [Acidimicrobiia bacterium]